MLPGKFRGFDINDPTRLNDGTDDDVKPDLDSLNSNVAGPSQPRTGGDGRGMASPLPRRRHATPIRPRQHPYPRPKAVSDSDGLGSDLTSTGKSSVHPPSPRSHSHEENRGDSLQPDPLHLGDRSPHQTTDTVVKLEVSTPDLATSSAGPQRRTRRKGGKSRKQKAEEKAALKREGWNQALVRFRGRLDVFLAPDGQPAGGVKPETALAKIFQIAKDDLKNSPLQGSRTGEGTRGPRGVDEYLKGLMRAILPVPLLGEIKVGVTGKDSSPAAFSRATKELESRLAAVNQKPALRGPIFPSHATRVTHEQDEWRVLKNEVEQKRREGERDQMRRVSRLFKATHGEHWSRQDSLGFSVLFLLYGPEIFPPDFIEVLPTTSES